MAKILAPNKEYNGVSASITFVNGVGETNNPTLIYWFETHGYKVEKIEPININPVSLEDLKKDQLKDLAINLEVEFNSKTTNEQLVELIKEKQNKDKVE